MRSNDLWRSGVIYRCYSHWLIVSVSMLLAAASSVRSEERDGFSRIRPSQGPYVKTDSGYMVPYRATIPETNVSFEMVPIPGGTFRLRAPKAPLNPERASEVEVTIEPFWIGRYEVTWAEYNLYCDLLRSFRRFGRLGIRKVTGENQIDAVTAPSTIYGERSRFPTTVGKRGWTQHPAVSMTQYAARQYTKWLSKLTRDFYRLPSEAEWEHACRAGSTTSFSFGDDARKLASYAWYSGNSTDETQPIGLKKPNRWGLYDMHGNASEWVLDQYSETYDPLRKAIAAGKQPIHWPTRLHPRTTRGGSWKSDVDGCQSAARIGSSVDLHEEEAMIPPVPRGWPLTSSVRLDFGSRVR